VANLLKIHVHAQYNYVTTPNMVGLGQTMWAQVGTPKKLSAGGPPFGVEGAADP